MQPYEIIAAPFTLWLAPVGTAYPLLSAAPASEWVKVGTNGDRSESEDGVTVSHSQDFSETKTAGSTGPVKAFRTDEGLKVSLTLLDVSLEQYKLALNSNAVSTTAAGVGTVGFKSLPLYRGLNVATHALLVRGASAYGDNYIGQYEIPYCYQSASPELVYKKGDPAGLALEFTALEDPAAASASARFGRLIMQHAVAL